MALQPQAGDDASIKKYLAGRLSDFKTELAAARVELAERLADLESTSAGASASAERLRTADDEHAHAIAELQLKMNSALTEAREQAVAAQHEQSQQAAAERARLVDRHEAEAAALRASSQQADSQTARVTAELHEAQLHLRERTNRLEAAEHELKILRTQCSDLRAENAELATAGHAHEKAASASRIEIAALAQSVSDKDALVTKSTSLLDAANEAKRNADEMIQIHRDSATKLQARLKSASSEISKGNSIIAKLQAEVRGLKGKLRLKAAVMLQQQEHATAKAAALEAEERACAEMRATVEVSTNAKLRAEEAAAEAKRQLSEAQELLRSNQQVIQWLNKELTEAQTKNRPYSTALLLAADAAVENDNMVRDTAAHVTLPAPRLPEMPAPRLQEKMQVAIAPTTVAEEEDAAAIAVISSLSEALACVGSLDNAPPSSPVSSTLKSRAGIACLDGESSGPGFDEYLSPATVVGS